MTTRRADFRRCLATPPAHIIPPTGFKRSTATPPAALIQLTVIERSLATPASATRPTGYLALYRNTDGAANTASGAQALVNNTSGAFNTAIGAGALELSTGFNNVAVGSGAGFNVTTASNVIAIGTAGRNISNSCFIANIRGVTTANVNTIPVLIDSAGQLGTASSSRRFKNEIKPMDSASESILALRPVTFHYKSDHTGTPQFGLIAEEVAAVNPDLVVRDKKGEIYTVHYDAVNAMLLNEFLKEHKKVEDQARGMREQGTTIAELKSTPTSPFEFSWSLR